MPYQYFICFQNVFRYIHKISTLFNMDNVIYGMTDYYSLCQIQKEVEITRQVWLKIINIMFFSSSPTGVQKKTLLSKSICIGQLTKKKQWPKSQIVMYWPVHQCKSYTLQKVVKKIMAQKPIFLCIGQFTNIYIPPSKRSWNRKRVKIVGNQSFHFLTVFGTPSTIFIPHAPPRLGSGVPQTSLFLEHPHRE